MDQSMEGFSGLGFMPVLVVNPRLNLGRGVEFTNAYQEEKAWAARDGWADFHEPGEDQGDGQAPADSITLSTEIPDNNVGFKMLQRLGWTRGKGLGRNEDGIVEPVQAGVEAGVRLGLGKQEEDNHFTNSELIERRPMESEVQANEDDIRRAKREAQAERDQKIRDDVLEIKRTFYCEVCHKQYEKAMEFEVHLSSYDHGHRKRLKEMQAMHSERTRDERTRKEAKAVEKEMVKLQQQINKAKQACPSHGAAPPPPLPTHAPPLPDEPPPPAPPSVPTSNELPVANAASGISFGLGRGTGGTARRGMGATRGRAVLAGGRGHGRGVVMSNVFGHSSSDEEV